VPFSFSFSVGIWVQPYTCSETARRSSSSSTLHIIIYSCCILARIFRLLHFCFRSKYYWYSSTWDPVCARWSRRVTASGKVILLTFPANTPLSFSDFTVSFFPLFSIWWEWLASRYWIVYSEGKRYLALQTATYPGRKWFFYPLAHLSRILKGWELWSPR